VAVAGALAEGTTTIAEAGELRVKESDRIATMVHGLQAMGVKVDEKTDGMVVGGGAVPRGGATIASCGDHRIAMAFAVLALAADAPVVITDTACVATSYPGFERDLEALTCRGV
jgi:3-phosphoshikimate 1-carboxyvinyltransferase